MNIAVTGATGFVGRYLVRRLVEAGHRCRAWHRPESNRDGLADLGPRLQWVVAELGSREQSAELVAGCDAVVHAALYHPDGGFVRSEGDLIEFAETNLMGTLKLVEAAHSARVGRFVFISTCAVYDKILTDRPLDETHPTTPASHYGAHKAALEQFVHSFARGHDFPICALRPTGVYGRAEPATDSKWYDLVRAIVRGDDVTCRQGGKEVHAADVARAAEILLDAPHVAGEAYNCYDRYVSEYDVAVIAKRICGSASRIDGEPSAPKHQIVTEKIRRLGMEFGGTPLLEQTIRELIEVPS